MQLFVMLPAAVLSLVLTGAVRAETIEGTLGPQFSTTPPSVSVEPSRLGMLGVSLPQPLVEHSRITAALRRETSAGGGAGPGGMISTCQLERFARVPLRLRPHSVSAHGRQAMGALPLPATIAAPVPEPADWMTPLCGLIVVTFIARRKLGNLPP